MRKLHILVFWLLSAESYAQLEVSAGTGVGWFSMRELGEFQETIKASYPVDAKITEEFPAYVIYDAAVLWTFRGSGFLGLYYQYGSTGGRVHYEDFSGEVYADQLLHYNTLALSIGQGLSFENNLLLRVDLHPGVTFTKLEIIESARIGNETRSDSYRFHSINYTLQPTVELHKNWGQFGVKVYAGFHVVAYSGKLKFEENKNGYLTGGGKDPIVANWNGFRIGLTATYRISRKEQPAE